MPRISPISLGMVHTMRDLSTRTRGGNLGPALAVGAMLIGIGWLLGTWL